MIVFLTFIIGMALAGYQMAVGCRFPNTPGISGHIYAIAFVSSLQRKQAVVCDLHHYTASTGKVPNRKKQANVPAIQSFTDM